MNSPFLTVKHLIAAIEARPDKDAAFARLKSLCKAYLDAKEQEGTAQVDAAAAMRQLQEFEARIFAGEGVS